MREDPVANAVNMPIPGDHAASQHRGHDRAPDSPEGTTELDARTNIVLIHRAWADGSCWSGVIESLQADGYHVTAPQFPLTSLANDVARLRQVLSLQDQAIPPDAERQFASRMGATTVEVASSHVVMVSRPGEVARLITAGAERREAG